MKTAFLLAVWVLAAHGQSARAQAVWPCETTPEIDHELRNPSLTDPQIALADRLAAFHELLARHPQDVFVHRRYQDSLNGNSALPQQERQLAEYLTAWHADPTDVRSGYLYARMLYRRDYQQAFAILTQLAEKHPECPWLHLALAEMRASRSMAKVQDLAESRRQLDTYFGQCPASLDPTGLGLIQQVGDTTLWQKTAERLRGQLESRSGLSKQAPAIAAWPQLWQLESRLQPATGQEQVRQRELADLARLRALNLTGMPVWYDVLQNGYAGLGDDEGRKWADGRLLQDLGSSSLAFNLVSAQWWQPRTTAAGRPVGDDTTRSRELLTATDDWITRWPNHPAVWQSRFRAVAGLKDTPPAMVEQVSNRFLELADRSLDARGGTVPPPLDVARLFVERGIALDQVPGLIRTMDQQLTSTYEAQRKIQYGVWANPAYLERYRWTTHWDGMKVLFDLDQKTGRTDAALEVLGSLQQSVANVDAADRVSQAAGWPMVLEMALSAGRIETARAALARLEAFRSGNRPAEGDPIQRAVSVDNSYWEGAARVAEAEGRKLDAVSFYLNSDSAAGRAQAHQLWTGLGGTDRGWDAAVDRSTPKSAPPAAVPQTGAAQTREKALPDFVVEDVAGKKVRLADLKGKTVLLNIWATWCAPCREELPQIEELSRTLKGRSDVAVVTLNADENPGLVKPFLDRAGYSFPVLMASDYVWKTLGVTAIPQNWIVDQAGVVRMDLESLDRMTLAKQALPLFDKLKPAQ